MTERTKMQDFEDAKGHVDFDAYRKAQVANGENCSKCGTSFLSFNPPGRARKCIDCNNMSDRTGEVDHHRYLRCPQCGGTWDPCETEDYEVFGDEEHQVTCGECDYTFEVSTHVSYTFTSPPRLSEKEQEAWQVEQTRKEAEWRERMEAARKNREANNKKQ